MTRANEAESHLRAGDPAAALAALQGCVRSAPGDPALRIFLFQVLCVLGQWSRAQNQLDVIAGLDAATLPMVQTYRTAVQCERLRESVFAGVTTPLLCGDPEPWVALLIEALRCEAACDHVGAAALRCQALDLAPPTAGSVDGAAFDWIADGDGRLGPVLELIVNGRYTWAPFHRLAAIRLDPPADLRDAVWLPATVRFAAGGELPALIPSRYPGSVQNGDGRMQLARATYWFETAPGQWFGRGQRSFATDTGDHALFDVRELTLHTVAAEADHG